MGGKKRVGCVRVVSGRAGAHAGRYKQAKPSAIRTHRSYYTTHHTHTGTRIYTYTAGGRSDGAVIMIPYDGEAHADQGGGGARPILVWLLLLYVLDGYGRGDSVRVLFMVVFRFCFGFGLLARKGARGQRGGVRTCNKFSFSMIGYPSPISIATSHTTQTDQGLM